MIRAGSCQIRLGGTRRPVFAYTGSVLFGGPTKHARSLQTAENRYPNSREADERSGPCSGQVKARGNKKRETGRWRRRHYVRPSYATSASCPPRWHLSPRRRASPTPWRGGSRGQCPPTTPTSPAARSSTASSTSSRATPRSIPPR